MIGNSGSYTGRLASPVVVNFTDSGTAVCTVTIYSEIPSKDGEGKYKREPINFTFWGNRAENIAKLSAKGTLIMIDAYAKNKRQEINGQTIYCVELIAEAFKVLDTKEKVECQRKEAVSK